MLTSGSFEVAIRAHLLSLFAVWQGVTGTSPRLDLWKFKLSIKCFDSILENLAIVYQLLKGKTKETGDTLTEILMKKILLPLEHTWG